jgi:hypothetical protein
MLAAVDHATHADQVADLEAGDVLADRGYAADDLVTWYAGVERARPLGAHLMQVGVADATIRDVDLDVVVARCASDDIERFERLVGGMGAIGFYGHGNSFTCFG